MFYKMNLYIFFQISKHGFRGSSLSIDKGIESDWSESHFSNADLYMHVTDDGISISFKDVHCLKASDPITEIDEGIFISFRDLQPQNVPLFIIDIEDGVSKTNWFREEQFVKA